MICKTQCQIQACIIAFSVQFSLFSPMYRGKCKQEHTTLRLYAQIQHRRQGVAAMPFNNVVRYGIHCRWVDKSSSIYLPWSVPIECKGNGSHPGSEEGPNDGVNDHAFSGCTRPDPAMRYQHEDGIVRNYTSFNSENKRIHVSLSMSLAVLEDSFRGAVLENPNNVK